MSCVTIRGREIGVAISVMTWSSARESRLEYLFQVAVGDGVEPTDDRGMLWVGR